MLCRLVLDWKRSGWLVFWALWDPVLTLQSDWYDSYPRQRQLYSLTHSSSPKLALALNLVLLQFELIRQQWLFMANSEGEREREAFLTAITGSFLDCWCAFNLPTWAGKQTKLSLRTWADGAALWAKWSLLKEPPRATVEYLSCETKVCESPQVSIGASWVRYGRLIQCFHFQLSLRLRLRLQLVFLLQAHCCHFENQVYLGNYYNNNNIDNYNCHHDYC